MDDIARLPAADRADLFVVTGTGRGLTSEMIEKDFWVRWTLKRLFTLPDPPANPHVAHPPRDDHGGRR